MISGNVGHEATFTLHRNHGNTSIELLLDVRLFICSVSILWRSCFLFNLHANGSMHALYLYSMLHANLIDKKL